MTRWNPTSAALGVAAMLCTAAANAADINAIGLLSQAEFRLLSRDVAAAVSYKPMIPAESMGLTGFDLGMSVTATKLANENVFTKAASGGDVPAVLPVIGLRMHKGLPLNIDLGISYSALPATNVRATGGELRWAVLPGSTALPAVALRLSVANMSGVSQMKLRTTGYDISVSKGFAFVTPYFGVGRVDVKSSAPGVATLSSESFGMSKTFAGVNLAMGVTNLAFEADRTGGASSYGLKFGVRF